MLRAVREDEAAARALGKNADRFRLQAFAIGGAIMGLAGAVQAHFIGFIAPENYLPMLTFQVWAMLIVGGSGNNRGAILGAVVVWGVWALSGSAIAALFPPGQQARAAALQIVLIGVVALRHPPAAPARHPRRGAHGLPPSLPPRQRGPRCRRLTAPPSPAAPRSRRVVCGLWQVADIEKARRGSSTPTEGRMRSKATSADGFDTFDMADHYGSAELIAGRLLARHHEARGRSRMTKWCPEPGPMTAEVVRAGVQARLDRLGVAKRRPPAVPLVELRAPGLARRAARDGPAARRRA